MSFINKTVKSWWGAVAFYTVMPLPPSWSLDLGQIARFAPFIGILIGGLLGIEDWLFSIVHVPILTRSLLVMVTGIAITGGLHLDGVIDTADGLAVLDPQKRLDVMKDSATGAFGVMAAVIVIFLKVGALSEIDQFRWLILILTMGWGRWAQVCAIALYPYLKAEGKGSFHKEAFQFPQDLLFGWIILVLLSIGGSFLFDLSEIILLLLIAGTAIPLLVSGWFNWQLGGHTGDTYGAVVEWSEAFYLCVLTVI
ncbi:MAG: adenosylcobinamide-GDP ribazoletransferase [Halothece sp. Uz-M2-17]|nr:adenosylcobinamide-GDP ribazoletransferase [Halothece sp. Uz-M2-17]